MQYNIYNLNNEIIEGNDIYTKYKDDTIVLKNLLYYYGITTRQYVENGEIQSIIDDKLIIKIANKFMYTTHIEYKNKIYTIAEFINMFPDFVYYKFK